MNKKFYDILSETLTCMYNTFAYDTNSLLEDFYDTKSATKKFQIQNRIKKEYVNYLSNSQYNFNSYDQLEMMFEKNYSYKSLNNFESQSDFLNYFLDRLSRAFISYRDGKYVLKYWELKDNTNILEKLDGLEKIELWNSFSRGMSTDLLVASYLISNNFDDERYMNNFIWLINIADSQLEKILDKGVSENHIHINAGYSFYQLWERMVINVNNISKNELANKINLDTKEKLDTALILRYILELYFQLSSSSKESLKEVIEKFADDTSNKWYNLDEMLLNNILEDILNGKAYTNKDLKRTLIEVNASIGSHIEENHLVFKGLLKTRTDTDEFFNSLFWQYVRIKNDVLRAITQPNFYEGLDYFADEYFSKVVKLEKDNVDDLYEKIKIQIKYNPLKKIEIRISPGSKEKEILNKINAFFNAYLKILEDPDLPEYKIPTIGIVFHLIKTIGKTPYECCFYNEHKNNIVDLGSDSFYGKQINEYIKIIDIIKKIRLQFPKLSFYIVGIDAASKEHSTEPWVFAPVYQKMRDSSISEIKFTKNNIDYLKTIGFTYHVGEDYRHVISGLRHIHEVVEYFGYHVGDRIGHGISLGIEVEDWIRNNPVVYMPRIEYLENLIWLWGVIGEANRKDYFYNSIFIEREALQVAKDIYGTTIGITMQTLWDSYKMKFQKFEPTEKEISCFCNKNGNENFKICDLSLEEAKEIVWTDKKLLYTNHCKIYLLKMYEVIPIKVSFKELGSIEEIQKKIKQILNLKGIIIETNPSSNLSISGMDRLYKHTATKFNKVGLENNLGIEDGLVISINSDDPSVFNCNVSNEIAYIYYMLHYQGYNRDSILNWIDKIREWGMSSSFVDNRVLTKEERIKEIHEILNDISILK